MEFLNPKNLLSFLKENLKDNILDSRITTGKAGIKEEEFYNIWLEVKKEKFRDTVKLLMSLHYPHIAIIVGNDTGESIDLTYLFTLFYGEKFKEISLNLKVSLEREKPSIDSITDLLPGAQTTEREIKEMFGVEFIGLPEMRNIFLPEDFPKDVFPLRKEQKGLDELVQQES